MRGAPTSCADALPGVARPLFLLEKRTLIPATLQTGNSRSMQLFATIGNVVILACTELHGEERGQNASGFSALPALMQQAPTIEVLDKPLKEMTAAPPRTMRESKRARGKDGRGCDMMVKKIWREKKADWGVEGVTCRDGPSVYASF